MAGGFIMIEKFKSLIHSVLHFSRLRIFEDIFLLLMYGLIWVTFHKLNLISGTPANPEFEFHFLTEIFTTLLVSIFIESQINNKVYGPITKEEKIANTSSFFLNTTSQILVMGLFI